MLFQDITDFINDNRFPLLSKLTPGYIRKLQQKQRKLLVAAVNSKNQTHLKFLKEVFLESVKKTKSGVVNVFIDFDEDKGLFEYFKITDITVPKIVIFDFATSRYHVDKQLFDTITQQKKALQILITKIKNGSVEMISGNFFEDLLMRLGIEVNPTTISVLFIGVVVVLVLLVIGFVYFCDGSYADVEDEKKEEILAGKLKEENVDETKKNK